MKIGENSHERQSSSVGTSEVDLFIFVPCEVSLDCGHNWSGVFYFFFPASSSISVHLMRSIQLTAISSISDDQ
jgi:hypothetical protein